MESVFKIINKLAKSGVKGIGITGGEPLSRKDILYILEYIHSKNLKICLATNTDFYNKYYKQINKYVDVVGIPVEGSTEKIHDAIRGIGNFKNVTNALRTTNRNNKKIYITTVVTKNNILDITNIENLLVKYKNKITYWKLYELIKYYNRPFQKIKHTIPLKIIRHIIKNIGKKLGRNKTFYLTSKDRSETSFIINPNGDAVVPQREKDKTYDILLGNILSDDIKKIFEKWNNLIDYNKYKCHKCALKNGCIKMDKE
jgi:MoaA/NifB/PqqE/SkfB family radical SAM enzyme